jgi:DNA helicase-2/ATP-dependent DNA helicase PcrA
MLYATSRLLYGGVQHNPPSRFLSEIDGEFQATNTFEPQYSFQANNDGRLFGMETDASMNQPVPNDEPRYVPDLNEGDGVRHKVFGVGTVMELDGDTAVVYFKGKGARKLNISFAPLEKL